MPNRYIACAAMLCCQVLTVPVVRAAPAADLPVLSQRADPHAVLHSDGYYYFVATVPEYDRLALRRARRLDALGAAREHTIWRKHNTGPMSQNIWAPELHFIDGKWYLYFTAGRADAPWDVRLYVLENSSANPMAGQWVERGQLRTGWDSFALDATTFAHAGKRYLVWTQRPADSKHHSTSLYIAPMATPLTLAGPATLLSQPQFEWEKKGHDVNEAPAVLVRKGRVFISYSASATDANYCLGLLSASAEANLLDGASWVKSPVPVFASSAANGKYGPGHNAFTTTADGKTDLMLYHARDYRDIKGNALHDVNRHTRVRPIRWRADGSPDFGVPGG